jgi:hypothetical protein
MLKNTSHKELGIAWLNNATYFLNIYHFIHSVKWTRLILSLNMRIMLSCREFNYQALDSNYLLMYSYHLYLWTTFTLTLEYMSVVSVHYSVGVV